MGSQRTANWHIQTPCYRLRLPDYAYTALDYAIGLCYGTERMVQLNNLVLSTISTLFRGVSWYGEPVVLFRALSGADCTY